MSGLTGSSPLARGLRRVAPGAVCTRGIIPARAGFTRPPPGAGGGRWDHPRSRGVYGLPKFGGGVLGGSSPLARGLLNDLGILITEERIIPARAGFTHTRKTLRESRRDHPRSRGVY